jgi:hypothetical protein
MFTRYIPFLPFVQAHIDHVMVKYVVVDYLEEMHVPGSDHHALSFILDFSDEK